MRLENVIFYLNLAVGLLEKALGEECMQKTIYRRSTNSTQTVKELLKEMIEAVKDVQLEKECIKVVDLDEIPTEININGKIHKALEISIMESRVTGICDNDDDEKEHFDISLKYWMGLARVCNSRAK